MMKLPDNVYVIMKWVCMVCLPACCTFYCVLDKCFGWGAAETVATISAALCAMIGSLIGVSSAEYNKQIATEDNIMKKDDDDDDDLK